MLPRKMALISSLHGVRMSSSHYDDVIMTMLASQITSLTVVYSIVYSGVNQRKHQSSASLAFVREIHRGPVNFAHKWPVTRKMFPFDDVIMSWQQVIGVSGLTPSSPNAWDKSWRYLFPRCTIKMDQVMAILTFDLLFYLVGVIDDVMSMWHITCTISHPHLYCCKILFVWHRSLIRS